MKSRRVWVASSWRQNASTLGVWRRSRPKISSRSPQSAKSGSLRVTRAESRGNRVVTINCAPQRSSLSPAWYPIFTRPPVSSATRPRRSASSVRLRKLSVGACRTELIVEVMDQRVLLLTDVTVLQFCGAEVRRCGVRQCECSLVGAGFSPARGETRWAYGNRLAAERMNPGLCACRPDRASRAPPSARAP